MQSYKRGLWLLILLFALVACGPGGAQEAIAVESPPQAEPVVEVEPAVEAEPAVVSEPVEEVGPAVEAASPCEITDGQLGQELIAAGNLALVDGADPNGTYAELEAALPKLRSRQPTSRCA